jgi:hypothetical protein
MAEVIAESAGGQVVASDIFDYGYGQAPIDFLHDEPLARPEWIITQTWLITLGGSGVVLFKPSGHGRLFSSFPVSGSVRATAIMRDVPNRGSK